MFSTVGKLTWQQNRCICFTWNLESTGHVRKYVFGETKTVAAPQEKCESDYQKIKTSFLNEKKWFAKVWSYLS